MIQVEAAKRNGSYLYPAASRLTFSQWADQWWQVWAADPDRSPTTLGAADSRLLPLAPEPHPASGRG